MKTIKQILKYTIVFFAVAKLVGCSTMAAGLQGFSDGYNATYQPQAQKPVQQYTPVTCQTFSYGAGTGSVSCY